MTALKIAFGMTPIFVFSILCPTIGVGAASAAGLLVALVVVAATGRGGIQELPAAQAVLMLLMTVVGFTGDAATDLVLVHYGPALVSSTLGVFIVVTARRAPFTGQIARATVPPAVWHNPRFLAVNTRISTAWGVAILFSGLCHVVAARIGLDGMALALRIGLNQVVPLLALVAASVYTKHVVAAARELAREKHLIDDPDDAPTAHVARGAHEAGRVQA